MVPFDECILGDRVLHERFLATTEILARLVSSAPRAVRLSQLEDATGRKPEELLQLCASLECAGLVQQDERSTNCWLLTCGASSVTLEDVYRCVLNERMTGIHGAEAAVGRSWNGDVNLFVMQAMIAVNQSVLKHLRQFSLDRLKISAAGMFPAPRRQPRETRLEDVFDLGVSGREADHCSPMQVSA